MILNLHLKIPCFQRLVNLIFILKLITSINNENHLIAGGVGFIGSHVVCLFVSKYQECLIINLDKLTYAGNLENLTDIETPPNYKFVKYDICDYPEMIKLFVDYKIDGVLHIASESYIDRSIADSFSFAQTNVIGTITLLQAAKETWQGNLDGKLFYHVSTDEVYGSIEDEGFFMKRHPMTHNHLILPLRQVAIILFVLMV